MTATLLATLSVPLVLCLLLLLFVVLFGGLVLMARFLTGLVRSTTDAILTIARESNERSAEFAATLTSQLGTTVTDAAASTARAVGEAVQTATTYPESTDYDAGLATGDMRDRLAEYLGADPDADSSDPMDAVLPPPAFDPGIDPDAPFGIPGFKLEVVEP